MVWNQLPAGQVEAMTKRDAAHGADSDRPGNWNRVAVDVATGAWVVGLLAIYYWRGRYLDLLAQLLGIGG